MSINQTFGPAYGRGVVVASVTTTSAASAVGFGDKSLVVTNTGSTNAVYLRTGLSDAVATTADYCLMPSAQVSISKPQDHTHVAYITAASTSSLHVIPGEGF
jgi:hypothetical protein